LRIAGKRIAEAIKVFVSADLKSTKVVQMGRVDLAVDEVKFPCAKKLHKVHECYLGGIFDTIKHLLTKKDASQRNSIESAGKCPLVPTFHRVGKTLLMETAIGSDHVLYDPGSLLTSSFLLSTSPDNVFKCRIESDCECSFLDGLEEAPGNYKILRVQDKAGIRRPPQNRRVFGVPRKNSTLIGKQNALYA